MGLMNWISQVVRSISETFNSDESECSDSSAASSSLSKSPHGVLVLTRKSSQFFDTDGDIAHEFYEERNGKMCRVWDGLIPVGVVPRDKPAINMNLSVVLADHNVKPQLVANVNKKTGSKGPRKSKGKGDGKRKNHKI